MAAKTALPREGFRAIRRLSRWYAAVNGRACWQVFGRKLSAILDTTGMSSSSTWHGLPGLLDFRRASSQFQFEATRIVATWSRLCPRLRHEQTRDLAGSQDRTWQHSDLDGLLRQDPPFELMPAAPERRRCAERPAGSGRKDHVRPGASLTATRTFCAPGRGARTRDRRSGRTCRADRE